MDWGISNCVINLSPEKERVFAEIARILKPGGQFSISDIVVKDRPDWVRANAGAYMACVAGALSEDEYLAGLRMAGLVDVQVNERLVYVKDQVKAVLSTEFSSLGLDERTLEMGIAAVEGKVWSAKVVGRNPLSGA